MIEGRALTFGDNVDTDQIIGAEHLTLATVRDMVKHAFKNHPNFVDNFHSGDIVVAGHNFGCGSSREQAPAVLRAAGVGAIVAKSFARIFFRNAINLGLAVLECEQADSVANLDRLQIDVTSGTIRDLTANRQHQAAALPDFIRAILASGGIAKHIAQRNDRADLTGRLL
jgi:3-isopropylmalate/(R)-2-methylmalate dehydratase small subunit